MTFKNRHCERQRSNPVAPQQEDWIASSLPLLAMTVGARSGTQNIENNPMQSSVQRNLAVAGMRDPAQTI